MNRSMRSLRGACLFAACLSAAVSVSFAVPAGRAAAQEGSVPQASGSSAPTTDTAVRMRPSDAARADFAAGLEAAAEERWSDAERAFRRSYEGSGAPVAGSVAATVSVSVGASAAPFSAGAHARSTTRGITRSPPWPS